MRILRKYRNRRIYDTATSDFVTLSDIRGMVSDGEPVRIEDARSGDDVTAATLLQIVNDVEGQGHGVLTPRVLELLIRWYDGQHGANLTHFLEAALARFLVEPDAVDAVAEQLLGGVRPRAGLVANGEPGLTDA